MTLVPALIKVSHLEGTETGLAERLASFLAQEHPHHTAKEVQGRLAEEGEVIGLDAIKKWVAGGAWPSWPSHVDALLRAYGQALVVHVFMPSVQSAEERELARISEAEQQLAARRARLDAARNDRRERLGLL